MSRPEIGQKGGQEYPVLKSIQSFLKQMAKGGARPAPTVLKELLQNADDAGATEFAIILDERDIPCWPCQSTVALTATSLHWSPLTVATPHWAETKPPLVLASPPGFGRASESGPASLESSVQKCC